MRENAFKQTKEKPRLKFNSGLALISLQTIGPWILVQINAPPLNYRERTQDWGHVTNILHTAILREVVEKNVQVTIPKGNMGYEQYTVPDTVAVKPTLLPSFSTRKHTSMAFRAILANIFEEQWTENHPQYWDCCMHFLRQPFSK